LRANRKCDCCRQDRSSHRSSDLRRTDHFTTKCIGENLGWLAPDLSFHPCWEGRLSS
jgi:hypothetical protein